MTKLTEEVVKKELESLNAMFFRTGSREICDPAPKDTDVDFAVLRPFPSELFEQYLEGFITLSEGELDEYGFPEGDPTKRFRAYRMGEVNLIVVEHVHSFVAWYIATNVARQLNLRDKRARIALFQGILYGNWNDSPEARLMQKEVMKIGILGP